MEIKKFEDENKELEEKVVKDAKRLKNCKAVFDKEVEKRLKNVSKEIQELNQSLSWSFQV